MVIAMVMVIGTMSLAVFAADDYTLTINNTVKDHTYTAYQIFKGTKASNDATDKSLGDPEWGADITTAGKQALYTAYGMTVAEEALNTSANILALIDKIADEDNNTDSESDKAVKFANVFFTTAADGSVTAKSGLLTGPTGGKAIKATGTSVVFEDLASGYYLVNDSYTAGDGETLGKDYSIARIAVQVVGNTTINNKADKPTLDKNIIEDSTKVKQNTKNIGDVINYQLDSKVPEMVGYEKYFYVVTDTMSKGLTFNDDVTIKIGNTTLTNALAGVDMTDADAVAVAKASTGKTFYVESSTDATTKATTIKIVFNNFIQYQTADVGQPIEIKYSATLNQDAEVTEIPNTNTAKLNYSNNPLTDDEGKPGTPNEPNEPTGVTPDVVTKTYSTELKLIKVDESGNTLTGAKFQVTGTKRGITFVNGTMFIDSTKYDSTKHTLADANTYYMLKDGTYSTTAPSGDNWADTYDTEDGVLANVKTYKKLAIVDKQTTTETVNAVGYVNASGELIVKGLGEGEYTITELVAPVGYNILTTTITADIDASFNANGDVTWTVGDNTTKDDNDAAIVSYNSTSKQYEVRIENNKGTELPSTGGIGTTLFYVIGAILVLGAGILLVTRRRMNAN